MNKRKRLLNYFAVYTLTGISGTFFFPFKDVVFVTLFIFFATLFFYRKYNFDKRFIIFLFYCIVIILGQSIVFSSFSLIGIVRSLMTFSFAYLIIKIVGVNWTKYLINIIYFFTIISFIFYIPSLFSPVFHTYVASIADKLGTDIYGYNVWGYNGNNFIIYTWRDWTPNGILRNAGNYTEAGAFGSVLVIVLMLNVIENKVLFSRKNLIFTLGVISTFSTSSYLALFLFLFFWLSISLPQRRKIIIYPIIIVVSIYSFISLPFLKEKIEVQYAEQVEEGHKAGRFGSAILDMKEIKRYPLTGRGFSKQTRSDDPEWAGSSNGITGLAVMIAPIGFILYFVFMYKSFRSYCTRNLIPRTFSYMIISIILILAFAQYILSTPLLYCFVFFGTLIKPVNEDYPFYNYPKL